MEKIGEKQNKKTRPQGRGRARLERDGRLGCLGEMSALGLAGRRLLALLALLAPLLIFGSLRVRRILAVGCVLPIGTHDADLLSLRVLVAYPQTGELYMKWKKKTS